VSREHGRLVVLVKRRAAIEFYVPFLSNFASALALALDNRRQQDELEAATERLRVSEQRYRQLFSRMTPGFALHEIITDDDGIAIDYRFLEANSAFERMTGLHVDEILGRTVLEVLPGLEHSWIERYGPVALDGRAIEFEDFSALLGRHYSIVAYSPEPGRFATIFTDITERKSTEDALRESERAAAAQEERSRLARDLHDSVTQALFAVSLRAESLTQADALDSSPAIADAVQEVSQLSRSALAQMRTMLFELRGDPLDHVPIRQLLRNTVEATESRVDTAMKLTIDGDAQLPTGLYMAVYRITQEALNNVARHAKARHAWVDLKSSPSRVRLSVSDDGRGFDPGSVGPAHLGLRSMRERAAETGARLLIDSSPGKGTRVVLEWSAATPADC
jgi:PAS domain S-box-containing protein